MSRYLELLEASSKRVGTSLCVGIDPDPAQIPSTYASSPDGVRQWVQLLVRASEPYAAAYKVNIAFFEALGSEGWAIAEEIRDAVPRSTPLIVDAKRGDIGNTVRAQARSLFDVLGADAVTAKSSNAGIAAVAKGDAEIAIQPVSELLHVPGTEFVATLPAEIQYISVFSVARVAGSSKIGEADQLIAFLKSAKAQDAIKNSGMEPLAAK